MNRSALHLALSVAGVLAAIDAGPAMAQADGGGAGDIVVTARRTEERLQDVPVAITVLNQAQLTDRNIVNAADLAISTPSLSVNNVIGVTTTTFSVRGFGQENGTEPAVGVYFADVVAPRGVSNSQPAGNGAGPGAFFDLQNVQVLKGPQGTLFGRNSTGGAILLVPQKPTYDFGGYAEVAYGNYDSLRLQGVLNVPLGEQARARIGVERMTRTGYMKNLTDVGPRDFNDVSYITARASLVVDLTPDLENYTIGTYTYSKTNGDMMNLFQANTTDAGAGLLAGLVQAQLDRYGTNRKLTTANVFEDPHVRSVVWQIINTTTYKVNDYLTIKNIVSYAQLKNNYRSNFFGNAYDLADLNSSPSLPFFGYPPGFQFPTGTYVNFQGTVSMPGGDTSQQSTFTEEFRLQGQAFDKRLDWQVGAYLEQSDPLGISGSLSQNLVANCPPGTLFCAVPLPSATPGIAGGGAQITQAFTKFRNIGVYAQGTYALTDQLKLTAGARYSWSRVATDAALRNFFYAFTPATPLTPQNPLGYACTIGSFPDCSVQLVNKSDKPTWTIGLDYKPTDDILTYIKWSRGFRAGSITPQVSPEFRTFQPETVDSYEVGLKTSFRGAVRGYFNVAAFYNDLTDQQIGITFLPRDPNSGVPSTVGVANAGKSRIYGTEVDFSISPLEGLALDVSYAYINAKIQEIAIPPSTDTVYELFASVRPGDPLVFVPKHKVTVTPSYTFPLDPEMGRLTISATYSYTSSQISSYGRRDAAGNLAETSLLVPRNTLDLNLNWKQVAGSNFDLSVFANNVTNNVYYLYYLDLRGGGGSRGGQVSQPRMYGARVRYSF